MTEKSLSIDLLNYGDKVSEQPLTFKMGTIIGNELSEATNISSIYQHKLAT